jgi:hypothetical protein
MKKLDFVIGNTKERGFRLAESWEDLGFRQITRLILLADVEPQHRTREIWEEVVQLCLGCSKGAWSKLVLSFQQWNWLKFRCEWVFNTRPKHKPFVYFEHQDVRYYLPEPNFGDSDALDVSFGNIKLTEFAHPEQPDVSALDELVATFCRPERLDYEQFRKSPDYNGDRREKFNDFRVAERAKLFGTLDHGVKVCVLQYFLTTNVAFLDQYEELFGGSGGAPRYGGGEGWLMVLKSVAKSGIFGSFDTVCHKPAHLVYAFMLDDLLDAKDQQKEAEKQNQS